MPTAIIRSGVVENVCLPGNAQWRSAMAAQGFTLIDTAAPVEAGMTWNGSTFGPAPAAPEPVVQLSEAKLRELIRDEIEKAKK